MPLTLLLLVLGLTATTTAVAHLLHPATERVALALLLDAVPFLGVVAATVIATGRLKREPGSLVPRITGIYVYFAGGLVAALGVAHLVAVLLASIARGDAFLYDFRLYSLVQLGVLLVAGGLIAALQIAPLARAERHAWRASLLVCTALLVINLPLVPIQGFAVLFSALAGFGLLMLGGTGRYFR